LDWLEVSVATDNKGAEAVAEVLDRYGWGQAVVEMPVDCFEHELPAVSVSSPVIVKTYLPLDDSAADVRRRLEGELLTLGQVYPIADPTVCTLAERDWTEAWKEQYHLQRIGRRTVIVPAWEEYAPAPGEVVIRLEPGMAFGTGLHATTRLCLKAMEEQIAPGWDVLDVGTGSGVLAIAAAKLGARSVLALDADPVAVAVARENAAMNAVADQVSVRHGTLPGGHAVPRHFATAEGLELLESGHFDLILINILAPVIIGKASDLAARLVPMGRVIASGLIESQEQEVTDAFRSGGLWPVGRSQEEEWVTLVAQRR
jgi:ribosomal protein L11 methyltransferase